MTREEKIEIEKIKNILQNPWVYDIGIFVNACEFLVDLAQNQDDYIGELTHKD